MIKGSRTGLCLLLLAVLTTLSARAGDVSGPSREAAAAPAAVPSASVSPALDPQAGVSLSVPAPAEQASLPELPAAAAAPEAAKSETAAASVSPAAAAVANGAAAALPQASAAEGAASTADAPAAGEKAVESWLFDKAAGRGQAPADPSAGAVMDEAQLAAYLAQPAHSPAKSIETSPKLAVFDSGDYKPEYEAYLRKHGYDMIRVLNPTRAEADRFGDAQGFTLKSEWLRWVAQTKPVDDYIAGLGDADAQRNFRRRLKKSEHIKGELVPLNEADFDAWFPVYEKQFSHGRVVHLDKDWARRQLADPKRMDWHIVVFRDPANPSHVYGGALVAPVPSRGHLSLGYAAYDESAKKLELSVRTFVEGLKLANALKLPRISYGADRSRFGGYDFAAPGLMSYKAGVRMTPFPEETVMLEKDLGAGSAQDRFILGLKRSSPLMDRYFAARDRGEKPDAETLLGGAPLEPGTLSASDVMEGHHFSKDGAKIRAPHGIAVEEHAL